MKGKTRVALVDIVDQLAQGRTLGGNDTFATDRGAQHRWNSDIGHLRSDLSQGS
jgi:hypothetical protein